MGIWKNLEGSKHFQECQTYQFTSSRVTAANFVTKRVQETR
jgi:hypothetical protein